MTGQTIHFDDLQNSVGRNLGSSGWTAIDQAQIDQFALLTSDHEWIHVDLDRSQRERGGTIAHGYHLLSLIPFLHQQILRVEGVHHGLNYGIDRLRFVSEVRPGANLRLNETLKAIDLRGEAKLMTIGATLEIEGKPRPAMVADCLWLFYPA